MSEKFNSMDEKIWSEHNAKRAIITRVLELAKNNQLLPEQKYIFFEMINKSNRTEKQKERFIKFYNLDITKDQNYTLTTLAEESGCKPSAIRFSLFSVITYTMLHDDKNMYILKKLLEV